MHVLTSKAAALFHLHKSRGNEAIDEMGILKDFQGILIHDSYAAYFIYLCLHALCGAHFLRELVFVEENQKEEWAKMMRLHLLEMLQRVHKIKELGKITDDELKSYEEKYIQIIHIALKYHEGLEPLPQKKRKNKTTCRQECS